MPDNQELLATTLLGAPVPNELIAVTLYQRASLKEKTPRQATALPAPYALATAKDDGWQAAAMQAMSATDQGVIAALARDRRVHVRLALAENPNITGATANDLWAWLNITGVDSSQKAHANVAKNADLGVLVEYLRAHPHSLANSGTTASAGQIIVARVFASGDDDYYNVLLTCSIREEVIRRTVNGDAPHSLEEMIQRFPEAYRQQMVRSLTKSQGLTRLTLGMLVAYDMLSDPQLGYNLVAADEVFDDVLARDPAAPESKDFYALVLRAKLTPERAGALLARFTNHETQNACVVALRRTLYRSFDALIAQLSAAEMMTQLDLVDENTATRFRHAIIEKCRVGTDDQSAAALDAEEFLAIIRDAPPRYLEEWMGGKLTCRPRLGDVFSIVSEHTTLKNRTADYWNLFSKVPSEDQSSAKEVLLAGTVTLSRLCHKAKEDENLRNLLNQVTSEALGDDPRTWMAFIEGATESVTLLTDLNIARDRATRSGFAVPPWAYERPTV